VLEYFDAYLIGLTATPAAHTFGFFHQNLVMEYPHERLAIDDALSFVARIERVLDDTTRRVGKLRQAILKWAFEGKLVDQNPNDAPASLLLERIRSERAARTEEGSTVRAARKR
jgi:hypothetical protein